MTKGRRSDFVPRAAQPAAGGGGMQPGMVEKIKKMQEEMAATQTASRADAVAWIPMRWSKALDDAVAAPHQPAPSADERRSPSDQDGVPATAAPYAGSRCPIS